MRRPMDHIEASSDSAAIVPAPKKRQTRIEWNTPLKRVINAHIERRAAHGQSVTVRVMCLVGRDHDRSVAVGAGINGVRRRSSRNDCRMSAARMRDEPVDSAVGHTFSGRAGSDSFARLGNAKERR